jgi:hypothetical protein
MTNKDLDLTYWKLSEETRSVVMQIDRIIDELAESIHNGSLLMCPDNYKLSTQYASIVGKIKGLQQAKELLTIDRNSEDEDSE